MSNFLPTDHLTGSLMPPSVDEWLPQKHLARFVVEVVDDLDLTAMSKRYRGTGSASYQPGRSSGAFGLWLRHRRLFQPETGAGHLRFGGIPLHGGERPSRPRYHRRIPTPLP